MTAEDCARTRCPPECQRTSGDQLNVYLGVTDRTSDNVPDPVSVTDIQIHPGWDRQSPLNNITDGHDLAILELDTVVTFKLVLSHDQYFVTLHQ